jgi:hypothetical protein
VQVIGLNAELDYAKRHAGSRAERSAQRREDVPRA